MRPPVLVGLLDSGLAPAQAGLALASRAFAAETLVPDRIGHGSALARLVLEHAPESRLLNGQIFHERPATTADRVAMAIDWAVDQGAALILLSLGLHENRPALQRACAKAIAAGVLLVASAPARGQPVFPAAYPGVIRASGDARCRPEDLSWFDGCFGACPRATEDSRIAGASFAAARVAGMLASLIARGVEPDRVATALRNSARFVGRERRIATPQ